MKLFPENQCIFIAYTNSLYCVYFAGSYCEIAGLANATGPCDAGYFCNSDAQQPDPTDGVTGDVCPTGHFCPQGTGIPNPCPSGFYSNATRNTELADCLACIPGKTM